MAIGVADTEVKGHYRRRGVCVGDDDPNTRKGRVRGAGGELGACYGRILGCPGLKDADSTQEKLRVDIG